MKIVASSNLPDLKYATEFETLADRGFYPLKP